MDKWAAVFRLVGSSMNKLIEFVHNLNRKQTVAAITIAFCCTIYLSFQFSSFIIAWFLSLLDALTIFLGNICIFIYSFIYSLVLHRLFNKMDLLPLQ